MSPSGGTVQPTAAEVTLASNSANQWKDYQTRWLPLQDHFASVVSDMGQPDSWQRKEAEGKGNVDAAASFAQSDARRTASEMSRGINVGSTKFKLGAANSASAEAESKGLAITSGNESIDKAYLANLGAIARTGQGVASTSVQGQGIAGETASRIGISQAQEQNETRANNYELAGGVIGAVGTAAKGISWGGGGGGDISNADLNNQAMINSGAVP